MNLYVCALILVCVCALFSSSDDGIYSAALVVLRFGASDNNREVSICAFLYLFQGNILRKSGSSNV